MLLQDISFDDPLKNIAFDDILLSMAEKGESGEILRFWETKSPFIVLGKICKEEEELIAPAVIKDKIPVLRRSSGGGTVFQAKGCLNYALVLSKKTRPEIKSIKGSYFYILDKLKIGFKKKGIKVAVMPISDLASSENNKKFSGNAQRRGKSFILHHGTFLYDFDIKLVSKYLNFPKKRPEYRGDRLHDDFLCNVCLFKDEIKGVVAQSFNASEKDHSLDNKALKHLKQAERNKYLIKYN